jgi:nucleoside-diphosphate-sugar epimerase
LLRAILDPSIAESDQAIGEEINIATQSEVSIGDLAELLIKKIRPSAKIFSDEERVRPEKSEVERLFGSKEKITRLTDWKQKFSLEQGLEETIAWFSDPANLARYKVDIYNV